MIVGKTVGLILIIIVIGAIRSVRMVYSNKTAVPLSNKRHLMNRGRAAKAVAVIALRRRHLATMINTQTLANDPRSTETPTREKRNCETSMAKDIPHW